MPTPLLLPVFLASPAEAVIYGGNPDLDVEIQRLSSDLTSGSGYLVKVRVYECDTLDFVDYPVGQTVDPVAGFSVEIQGGDLCGATLFWADDVLLAGADFVMAYGDHTTNVLFGEPIAPVALTPIEVVYGDPGGVAPRLYASVD